MVVVMVRGVALLGGRGQFVLADRSVAIAVESIEETVDFAGIGVRTKDALELRLADLAITV
jgi:hypothetical protein